MGPSRSPAQRRSGNHDSQSRAERRYKIRGGELLPDSSDLPGAIRRVDERMISRDHAPGDCSRWPKLIYECIAHLSVEELE